MKSGRSTSLCIWYGVFILIVELKKESNIGYGKKNRNETKIICSIRSRQ